MRANPLLKKLGLADTDRAVILHADDVGMCHASLAAYADLLDAGVISSAAAMVPCPWFPALAAFCRAQPAGRIDLGVHVTLNAEYSGYRWRPLTADPSLLDPDGYQPNNEQAVRSHATPDAVRAETFAQVDRALAAGIDVTHVDSHMGTVFCPDFLDAYLQAAMAHHVPALVFRPDQETLDEAGFTGPGAARLMGLIDSLEARGMPVLDTVYMMPLDQPDDRLEQVRRVLQGLPAGVHYVLVHPAQDTAELRAIAPDWRCRVADYRTFTDPALARAIRDFGIHAIGWRAIRDLGGIA